MGGLYRVTHLLANLGWVDLDLECSTILPSCSASSANCPSAQAEGGTSKIKVNPTQICQKMCHPVLWLNLYFDVNKLCSATRWKTL